MPTRVVALSLLLCATASATAAAAPRALRVLWTVRTRGAIAARPVAFGATIFAGSWDGYEYAIDARTGRVRWRTSLGLTAGRCPDPMIAGITSAPRVAGGAAYLGGGDAYWYALDARSGRVLWRVFTGDDSATGGHYNWSSPALLGGHAFVGVASLCDSPVVHGRLLRVNLRTRAIDGAWDVVPAGVPGGGIWTTPLADRSTGRVFVTTGNRGGGAAGYAESIVAVDPATMRPLDHWTAPSRTRVEDADWGTTPTLLTDRRRRRLVAAVDKNGLLYAFRRGDLHSGPVWQRRLAAGGPCPDCGDATVSTGLFAGGRLFWAAGRTVVGRRRARGSVRALDPATGHVLWTRSLPDTTLGGLVAGPAGTIVVPDRAGLYVLRARDGAVLHVKRFGSGLWATPLVSGGRVVVGTLDGRIRALALPRLSAPRRTPRGRGRSRGPRR